jgi:hypothetical protein
MKRAFLTLASLGLVALLVSMAPDLKRYLRIRSM